MNRKGLCKRMLTCAAAAVIAVSTVTSAGAGSYKTVYAAMNMSEFESGYSYPTQMRGLTAWQIVTDMGAGWNLGNSLESSNNETYWGNPATTKKMIDAVAAKGFTTLRVPVRWDDNYSDSSSYTINSSYLDRVETVVNYGLANDMYVIINIHHNDIQGMISSDTSTQNRIKAEMTAVWTQVANRFKKYGDKLIFETINEPRSDEDWTGNAGYYDCVNKINEAGRAAIRATGGNNAKRLVMMPTYCASGDQAKAEAWKKLADDDMVAASIHAYLPFDFAFNGDGHTVWNGSDLTELNSFFGRMKTNFLDKGIPVVIGEFGACNKNNTSERNNYASVYTSLARQFAAQDIPCVWWDNNAFGTGAENFGIFDRSSSTFTYGTIADNLVKAYKGDPAYERASSADGTVLVSSPCTSSNWGQAVKLDASAITDLKKGDVICCEYVSSSSPEMILQSLTDTNKGWVKAAPDSAEGGVAKWSYETLLKAFGGSFSGLTYAYIGDTGSSLTVNKVYVPGSGTAHTHKYNGTSKITVPATATTRGRKSIKCSVSGCTAEKIEMIEPTGTSVTVPKPEIISAEPGDGQVKLTWGAAAGADKYRVYYYLNGEFTGVGNTTNTYYTVKGLTNGVKYGFLVRAYIGDEMSDYSAADVKVYATPKKSVPKPEIISADPGDGQVKLTWGAVTGADKYRVYYYQNGEFTGVGNTTNTYYTVKGLTNGVQYGFLVRAYIGDEMSDYSAADVNIYATPKKSVQKPEIISAEPGDKQVKITWNPVAGADQYRVYYYYNGKFTGVGNTRSISYTVKNLVNDREYGFLVRAYVNGEISDYSLADVTVYAAPKLLAPKPVITSAEPGDEQVKITWDAVTGADQYRVYTYLNGKFTGIGNTRATSYTVRNLSNGTKYGFLVRAYVNGNISSYAASDVKTYAMPRPSVPKPQIYSADPGDGRVSISWYPVSGADQYRVYTYLNGKFKGIGNTTKESYTVKGLENGTEYGFLVRAYVNGVISDYSAADVEFYATPGSSSVPKPVITSAVPGNGSVRITWEAIPGAVKYRVYTYLNGKFTGIGNTTVSSYNVRDLTPGQSYGFLVRAYVGDEWSDYCAADVVTFAAPL